MLNKLKNIFTVKRIIVIVLFFSLAGNAFWIGNKWLNKERTKYYNAGVMYVFQQAQKIGQVKINLQGEEIILIYQK